MAENEDLEVLGSVDSTSPSSPDEETDEGADDEVEEGQHRPIVPGLSERESGFPTPTGRLGERRVGLEVRDRVDLIATGEGRRHASRGLDQLARQERDTRSQDIGSWGSTGHDKPVSGDRFGGFSKTVAYEGWKRSLFPVEWFAGTL
jgi:hypothetical protein